jgi:4'-phosphopantetheinyl transferase
MTVTSQPWRLPHDDMTLSARDVHVWRASLSVSETRLADFHAVLADDELARAARFRNPLHSAYYTVGRGVLRILLGRYLHRKPQDIRFAYTDYGKPFIDIEEPAATLRFNLSHSQDLALYAFTQQREIGIDIEYIRPLPSRDQIAKQFFSPNENQALRALPAAQQAIGFFNCWTRKEAYIKAHGEGLSLPLNQFDVNLAPGEPAALLETRVASDHAERWTLHALRPGANYRAALAVEGHDWALSAWQWPG